MTLSFPSGRTADEVVVDNAAGLVWVVNLGCMELHPHPVRTADLDHPDELRVDLDPQPGVEWADVRTVAMEVKALLDELGLVAGRRPADRAGCTSMCASNRGGVYRGAPGGAGAGRGQWRALFVASSKWWKEERHGVFLDYNQNAKDRTTCSAFSVRPLPDARVSTPLRWDEVMTCDPADFTVLTVPDRFEKIGDPHAAMDEHAGVLDALLELAARDEAEGIGDAPWPPHFEKQSGEARRVAPSRAKKFSEQIEEGFGAHRFHKQSEKQQEQPMQRLRPRQSSESGLPVYRKCRFSSSRRVPTGLPPRPAWSVGNSSTLRPPPCSCRTMSWWTACAARPTCGIAFA